MRTKKSIRISKGEAITNNQCVDLSQKHEFISDSESICSPFLQLVLVITSDWTSGEDGYSYYEMCINEMSRYDKAAKF